MKTLTKGYQTYITNHPDKVNWNNVSAHYTLPEEFMDRWAQRLNWMLLSHYQELSMDFIDRHASQLDWDYVTIRQELSEAFMDHWCDELDWGYVSRCQHLSEEFIMQHLHLLDLDAIHQRYPEVYENYNLNLVQALNPDQD